MTLATKSPAGVVVSMTRSRAASAHPCFLAVSISEAKSGRECESLSYFATPSASASPLCKILRSS